MKRAELIERELHELAGEKYEVYYQGEYVCDLGGLIGGILKRANEVNNDSNN